MHPGRKPLAYAKQAIQRVWTPENTPRNILWVATDTTFKNGRDFYTLAGVYSTYTRADCDEPTQNSYMCLFGFQ